MSLTNIEIKTRCSDPARVRRILNEHNAEAIGTDHQIDTYFNVPDGRLKLREGDIENNLIYYRRSDAAGPAKSDIHLVPMDNPSAMKELLTASLGICATVDKQREIYFIDNVKFHIDQVKGLGSFAEIEAIDEEGTIPEEELHRQCSHYMDLLSIEEGDLVERSYSDMVDGV